jgi:two-component sensor histidine kinase/putative methionine-R-sulfoxide reductase with GAF domain
MRPVDPRLRLQARRQKEAGGHGLADNGEQRLLLERAKLADFGLLAVEGAELDELLQAAAAEAARSLDVSYVKVLEYLAEEKCLLVRAGVGWGEGVVGQARIGADIESPAGYALQTGRPVISNELHKEERFCMPALLRDHGVKSAANVIIKTRATVFGVLEADSREPCVFTEDDVKFLQGYATLLAFAIEQARLSELNRQLAMQHELLMQELQHRIKNNNQSLLSLIHLQLASVTNLEAREQLQKIESRIRALSFVNSQLQVGARANVTDLGQYLMAIISSLFNFQKDTAADVKLTTQIAQIEISTQRAQAIGLILNEFLTNSFKYAFTAGTGTFTLSLSHEDGRAVMIMADDGPGIPEDAAPGLGLSLIGILTNQLEGEATWTSEGNGATLTLEFPIRAA